MGLGFFVIIIIAGFFILGAIILVKEFFGGGESVATEPENPFEKKPFVFDAMSELMLYRTLMELFGDRYYIFPQVVYSRLMQLKKGESLRHRTYFDKKIADFVLCDKEKAVAQLVIELDGSSHQLQRKIDRDSRVDTMMHQIGLPILHLKSGNMDKDFIKGEVERALAAK